MSSVASSGLISRAFRTREQGIKESQTGEAGKVTIDARQSGAVLNGERGQVGIRRERPGCLTLNEESLEDFPVPLPWVQDHDILASQPLRDNRDGFFDREWVTEEA